jgi:N-acetyl-anhydromuramyl-L-alanine amidase AmpD
MTDFVWSPGVPGCRKRRQPIAGVVWHWTASDNGARAVQRTLKRRGLSIHYVIDYAGVVTQCADPATTVCLHAGSKANERFIGVEIANRALLPASPRRPRTTVSAMAHGQRRDRTDFTPAQYAAILRLAAELSASYAIPRQCAVGDTTIDIRNFRGHAEHIHVSHRKIDCGTLVMAHLRANGFA